MLLKTGWRRRTQTHGPKQEEPEGDRAVETLGWCAPCAAPLRLEACFEASLQALETRIRTPEGQKLADNTSSGSCVSIRTGVRLNVASPS
jgi:hypothetical protein